MDLDDDLSKFQSGNGLDASGVTDGKLLIGKSTGSFALSTLTGTADQVTVTNGPGSIILSLPQSIASTSSPTFAGLTLNGPLTANSSVGTSGYALVSQGAGLSPTWKDLLGSGSTWQGNVIGTQYGGTGLSITSAANGQLLIGNGTGFSINSLAGTTDQITVTNGPGSITLSLPQSIATTSSPIFAGLTLKGALTLNNSVATSGYVLTANGPGISPVWQDISAQTLQEDGNGNIKGGTGALASITSGAGVYNLALGHNALNKLTGTVNNGYYNIALGSNALTAATTATQSIAIGYNALASQLSGSGNLAIGAGTSSSAALESSSSKIQPSA